MCWTLGITEHHNGVDNVLSLINLNLLCGHVGRYGAGINPLRGQNNVQGGGDMGAIPNKLTGFQDILDDNARHKFESAWNCTIPNHHGWHLTQMFEAMERKELRALYVIGENPAQSEADSAHAIHILEGLEHMVVQDIFLTKTAELADVVLPASAAWCETNGTVTNSERRVQRVRKAINAPGGRTRRYGDHHRAGPSLGHAEWDYPERRNRYGTNCVSFHRCTTGCRTSAWKTLAAFNGHAHPTTRSNRRSCTGGCGPRTRLIAAGWLRSAPLTWAGPVDLLTDDFPIRLTTGRRLDSYNTGVQTGSHLVTTAPGRNAGHEPRRRNALGNRRW